jgi:hypothetical protein
MRNLIRIVILSLIFLSPALAGDSGPMMLSWLMTGGPAAPYLTMLPALFLCQKLRSPTLAILTGGLAILIGPAAYNFAFEKLMDGNFVTSIFGFLFGPATILFGIAAAALPVFLVRNK